MDYVEVAVNIPQVTGVFHYHLPPDLQGQVAVGNLVVVPFGKQVVHGVVLRFVDQPEVAETRPVADVVDPQVALTPLQIALARHIAESSLGSLAAAIGLMLPPGLAQQADVIYSLNGSAGAPGEKLNETQARLLALLQRRGPLRGGQIDQALRGDWRLEARTLLRRGRLLSQPVLPPPRVQPKFVRTVRLACTPEAALAALPKLGPVELRAVRLAVSVDELKSRLDETGKVGSQVRQRRQGALESLAQAPGQSLPARNLQAESGAGPADLRFLAELGLVTLEEAASPILERRQAVLRFLLREPAGVDVAWVYAQSGASLADLRFLAEQGLVQLGESETQRDPLQGVDVPSNEAPALTSDQQAVWEQVQRSLQAAFAGQAAAPILLHGVTGSGKTEIYLRAVEYTLSQGRQAIVLVPEIALTPQAVQRFLGRFPGQVGLLHSGLSEGERYDTWRRARAGDLGVMVGPRSALFAPLPKPGLVVVDECHDDSYYQSEPAPYYHAREAAVAYARLSGAVCLLGSATPDVTSRFRAAQGQWQYLHLPARILAHRQAVRAQLERLQTPTSLYRPLEGQAETQDLPPVQVVDMRRELQSGNRSIFSRALQQALGEVLQRQQQAILFLNRRGTATYIFCRDCGHTLKCPRCELPLTYHLQGGAQASPDEPDLFVQGSNGLEQAPGLPGLVVPEQTLVCHYCGYRRKLPAACPECRSRHIRHYGTGTERVEADLQALFPGVRTLRWDYESTRKKGAHEIILSHFAAHRADVLVGTQMLAKGLDLPLVTLVGAVLADVGLNLPDYRAAERTFQVLTQVAGRAGRSPLGGQVILQSFQPEHHVIQAAAGHDYAGFYQQELEHRRQLAYPPFANLVRLEYRHNNPLQAEQEAHKLAGQIRAWLEAEDRRATQMIGPVPCFFARLGGQYRWQIVLRGPDPASIVRQRTLDPWKIEVNPPNLL